MILVITNSHASVYWNIKGPARKESSGNHWVPWRGKCVSIRRNILL